MVTLKSTVLTLCAIAVAATSSVAAQADGNPKGWDRIRRCDADYSPECEPCEGIGGIATGDKESEFSATKCSVIARADELQKETLVSPEWGKSFEYRDGYHEILIGTGKDPFCFQVTPGPTSAGTLCYRREEGSIFYDMNDAKAIEIQLNMKPKLLPFNISSTVLHQGTDMWITNQMPLGVKQCICVGFKNLYPVNSGWTSGARLIAREQIMVEYIWEEMVLDHYVIGPHHLWSDIKTGDIVRMWQPWNGLEVMDPAKKSALSKKITFPPEVCKKNGGAQFRINCNDEGFPASCSADECNWTDEDFPAGHGHRNRYLKL